MKVKLLKSCFVIVTLLFSFQLLHAQADVGLITAVARKANVNGYLTYSFLVVNQGPEAATNVILRGSVPYSAKLVSFTAPEGWHIEVSPGGSKGPVLATINSLPSGYMQVLTMVVDVSGMGVGMILNGFFQVTSDTRDPISNNGSSFFPTITDLPTPDVGVEEACFLFAAPQAEDTFIYLIQVTNNGKEPLTSVSLTNVLVPGLTLVSLSSPDGWKTSSPPVSSSGTITASIPELLPGGHAEFIVEVKVGKSLDGSRVTIASEVSSSPGDKYPDNNYALLVPVIGTLTTPALDLAVFQAGPATVTPGSTFHYAITLTNLGFQNSPLVTFTDTLQSGSTFVSMTPIPGSGTSTPAVGNTGIITSYITSIPARSGVSFEITVKVADTINVNSLVNSVYVRSLSAEPDLSNNVSVTSAAVIGRPCSLVCPENITVSNDEGKCGAFVNFSLPAGKGNCGTITTIPASGSFFSTGLTNVEVIAGSAEICSFTVNVIDKEAPLITPRDTLSNLCANSGGNYIIPRVTTSDNCGLAETTFSINGATTRSGTGDDASGAFDTGTSVIRWTVKDSSGNSSTLQTTVIINDPLVVTIPDAIALNKGVNSNTVYTGYAPASKILLNAKVTGGSAPYIYLWSNGDTTASTSVSPAVASKYTVTITDLNGCKQVSEEKLVKVTDVRCGNKGGMVQVCVVPPANFGIVYSSCVDAASVDHILQTGARLGNCSVVQDYTLSLKAMPNPAYNYFVLDVISGNTTDMVTLSIYNVLGKIVESRKVKPNSKVQIGQSYRPGIYVVEAIQSTKRITLALLKL